jgi:hypothetical protein
LRQTSRLRIGDQVCAMLVHGTKPEYEDFDPVHRLGAETTSVPLVRAYEIKPRHASSFTLERIATQAASTPA